MDPMDTSPSTAVPMPMSPDQSQQRQQQTSVSKKENDTLSALMLDAPSAPLSPPLSPPPPPPHTLAIDVDTVTDAATDNGSGRVLLFGSGSYGVMCDISGSNDESNVYTPTPPPALRATRVRAISLGASHGLIASDDGLALSFGDNNSGELGLGHTRGPQFRPAQITALDTQYVSDVAVGFNHSAALTNRGELLMFGNGELGQMGVNQSSTGVHKWDLSSHSTPVLIKSLLGVRIVKVVLGEEHTLALSDTGTVYACGDATRGATGLEFGQVWNEDRHRVGIFSPVTALAPLPVIDIAAGSHHSLVLTATGAVYAFGKTKKGQCGLGVSDNVMLPKRIEALNDATVVRVFAGGDSSAVITSDGSLYTFGANQHGQLGTGDRDSRFTPIKITEGLESKRAVKVAMGSSHTLVQCDDHTVLGFGDTSFGQLGLGRASDGNKRQKMNQSCQSVNDSDGASVSASVSGYGDILIPTPVPLPIGLRVLDIAAGSTSSAVVLSLHRSITPLPLVSFPPNLTSYGVQVLDTGAFQSLVGQCRASTNYAPLLAVIHKIFGSAQSLNASFLPSSLSLTRTLTLSRQTSFTNIDPFAAAIATPVALLSPNHRHQHASNVLGGIDIDAVESVYKAVLKASVAEPKLLTVLSHAVQRCVSELLTRVKSPHPPTDSAAYRALAICLQAPFLSTAGPSEVELLNDIAQTIQRLPLSSRKALRRWWSAYSAEIFGARLVKMVVNAIIAQLREARLRNIEHRSDGTVVLHAPICTVPESVQTMTQMVALMHEASLLAGPTGLIEAKHWHIPIAEYVHLESDFLAFIRAPASAAQMPAFSFLRHPFLLNATTKSQYLRVEHFNYQRSSMYSAMMFEQQPFTTIQVKRDNLVESTIYQLNQYSTGELQRPLKVQFEGEEAVDQGGVSVEFFRLVVKELLSPAKYALFDDDEERRMLWYNLNEMDPSKSDLYYVAGLLLGLSVYNVCTLDGVSFPLALYKSLLYSSQQPIVYTLDDLYSLDPQLTRSLQQLLAYDSNDVEEVLGLTFTATQPVHYHTTGQIEIKTVELIPNGSSVSVTANNKQQYVHALIQYHLHGAVKQQSQSFIRGFRSICRGRVMELFCAQDLEAMLMGTPVLDFGALKRSVRYDGGYSASTPVIQWLWDTLIHELTHEQKERFLTFVTGTSRIGLGGLQSLVIIIQRAGPDTESWPTASTCFSVLLLPEYSSKERLKEKLVRALEHSEGFGLQ